MPWTVKRLFRGVNDAVKPNGNIPDRSARSGSSVQWSYHVPCTIEGLDQKTRQLIYIAMKASMGDQMAVTAHIPMAKAAGATKEEVVDAILLTLTVSGIRGVVTCLPEVVRQYE